MNAAAKFPATLVADGRLLWTPMGLPVARCETQTGAAEIARRWNAHPALLTALEAELAQRERDIDAAAGGGGIRAGEAVRDDSRCKAMRAAISAAKGG